MAKLQLGDGLIGIESLLRPEGLDRLKVRLRRKDELAVSLDADWFMHMDPDEIRLPPRPDQTLAQAFEDVDSKGYNAVNFVEFTFIPTYESSEHDHPDFQRTMRWYYPFTPRLPHHVKAWKKQATPIELEKSGGHKPNIPNLLLYPEPFKMRHYQFLSLDQAREKYLQNKKFDRSQVNKAYWRGWLVEERMGLSLPSEKELNTYTSDGDLSLSNPRTRHVMEDWALPKADRTEDNLPAGASVPPRSSGAEKSREELEEGTPSLDLGNRTPQRGRPEQQRGRRRAEDGMGKSSGTDQINRHSGSQNAAETDKLVSWLQQLDSGIVALLSSRRWKIGNALGRALDIILRRQGNKTAADHLQGVLREFRDWRSRNGNSGDW